MQIDDAALMAYVMGDLSPAAAARIEAALLDDPKLAARLERIRGVRRALRSVYDSVAAEPVPQRLRALLGDVAVSEANAAPPKFRPSPAAAATPSAWRSAPMWAALAAGLIIGVLVGRLALPSDIVAIEAGLMQPSAELARVLEARLTRDADNANAPIVVGATFLAQGGVICRAFALPEAHVAGLACREGDRWNVRLLESAPSVAAAAAVQASIDDIMLGEPLDAAAEEAARARGWIGGGEPL